MCRVLDRGSSIGRVASMVSSSPISEWEQWAAAHHYVEKHGDEAPVVVAMRADELLNRGEVLGASTYIAIMRKSEELLSSQDRSLH